MCSERLPDWSVVTLDAAILLKQLKWPAVVEPWQVQRCCRTESTEPWSCSTAAAQRAAHLFYSTFREARLSTQNLNWRISCHCDCCKCARCCERVRCDRQCLFIDDFHPLQWQSIGRLFTQRHLQICHAHTERLKHEIIICQIKSIPYFWSSHELSQQAMASLRETLAACRISGEAAIVEEVEEMLISVWRCQVREKGG